MDGRTLLAAQTLEGLSIWDLSDVPSVSLLADFDLPGIEGGDYAGNWWVNWQAPYAYVAGRNAGLYIVDVSDPAAPVLANHLPTGELGGLGPAIVHAVGNLLILTSNPAGGILTMDASDPLNPTPIQLLQGPRGYSHVFAGGLLLELGGQGDPEQLHVFQVSHDGSITQEPSVGDALGTAATEPCRTVCCTRGSPIMLCASTSRPGLCSGRVRTRWRTRTRTSRFPSAT